MKIKTLIIDDEEPARNLVKKFLLEHSELEVIGEFADGFSAVKAINEYKPDLVFLDVQMPKLTGFEVLELIEHKPAVIFATAFDQFAIKAFEANAADYLLKPFTRERFAQAIEKAMPRIVQHQDVSDKIKSINSTVDEKVEILQRIAVKSGTKIHVISVDDICFFEADGDYVMIHTKAGKFLKEKTMRYFETHLDNQLFIRIHRSFIANANEILRIEHYEKENYMVILKNNEKLKASMSGYKLLKQVLNM